MLSQLKMGKCALYISIILIGIDILYVRAISKEICEKCVETDDCPMFLHMKRQEKQMWIEKFPCDGSQNNQESPIFGFASIAKGYYICCPSSNVWEIKTNYGRKYGNDNNNIRHKYPVQGRPSENAAIGNFQNPNKRNPISNPDQQQMMRRHPENPVDQNIYGMQQSNRQGNQNHFGDEHHDPMNLNIYNNKKNGVNHNPLNEKPTNLLSQNIYGNNQNDENGVNSQKIYGNQQISGDPQYDTNGGITGNPGPYYPNSPNLFNPEATSPGEIQNQNPYFLQRPNTYPQQQQNSYLNNGNGNSLDGAFSGGQCAVRTALLPDPKTGCCGQDMSDSVRITDLQSILNTYVSSNQNSWSKNKPAQFQQSIPYYPYKHKRSAENKTVDVVIDNRIAGGKETDLAQYPWTVLLKITFDYGNKQVAYSCGGSLISPKYVLTAGHCFYEDGAKVTDVEITLAEYDKRTFPIDCKSVFGGRKQCVENVLMYAERIIHHPEYDDVRLHNDIALIRLHGYAPYTRYIRSICLPDFDIDEPNFSNLPLAVAGWGRNGPYITDTKQSTVVNLFPHDECVMYYPHLSDAQLCAAGRTGEDTCKGDSGGPLMTLYRGSYYVVGIVSGKRADSPCGTAVPSLYTNVYKYVPWIESIIRS